MPQVGFEHMIPVFERANTVHALDHAATVIGNNSAPTSEKNHCISIRTSNRLMLFKEMITVYSENYMKFLVPLTTISLAENI
jgi:hypothetical protein